MNSFAENIRSQIKFSDTLKRLLIVNVGLFLFFRIANAFSTLFLTPVLGFDTVSHYLAVPASLEKLIGKPWTVVTYMFFHWDILHLLFNMLWLFWMGKIFQEYLGNKKLLNTYISGGLAGALFFIAAYNFFPLFSASTTTAFALGASASVLAVTVATATLLPNHSIQLLIFGAVKLKWIALVIIFLDLISISGSNAGGHIAHLGGALYGFVYIRRLQRGKDISAWLTYIIELFTPKKRMKVKHSRKKSDEEYNLNRKARQARMDEILDKISKSGYGSLTNEEKDFLFMISKDDK